MDYALPLALASALGSGLVAGVFYAFSTFVMQALARLSPVQGIAAMQSINILVLNPWFVGVFMGTALLCVVAVIVALLQWGMPGTLWLLVGGIVYLTGSLAVTIRCNVPRNNLLAAVAPVDTRAVEVWTKYVAEWTWWNHVRTAASFAAALSFSLALAA